MEISLRSLLVPILSLIPLAVAVILIRRKEDEWRLRNEVPFREFRRRPAGESLRLKVAELDERINERLVLLVLFPVVLGTFSWYTHWSGWIMGATACLASLIWSAVFGYHLYRLDRERANYQLGFNGERFVGEELTRLMAEGFEVYHDVPFEGFNIDHVLVGTPGVFAVETKTRRKPIAESGDKEYRVEFDGTHLQWPWGADARGVGQAVNNARSLAEWLSSAVGESVAVTPILTLPGWLVERKAPPAPVHVVNPKEIVKVCQSDREPLSEDLLRRICHQLDQKCRIAVD
jgi:hypothetical protein